MRPDKHKKKAFLRSDRRDYGVSRKDVKIREIQNDEDKLDGLSSKGKSSPVYRGQYASKAVDRLLQRNVGQPWDDVYSKLVTRLGDQTYQALYHVSLHTYVEGGQLIEARGWGGHQEIVNSYYSGFYVTPEGILLRKERKKYRRTPSKKIAYIDNLVVFKHKGLYFSAPRDKASRLEPISRYYSGYSTSPLRDRYSIRFTEKHEGKNVHYSIDSSHIRQISAKDVKHFGSQLPDTEIND